MERFRLEIGHKKKEFDIVSKGILQAIKEDLQVLSVKTAVFSEFFELELNEEKEKACQIAEQAFIDPVTQKFSLNEPLEKKHGIEIEVRLLPSITDNVALTAKKAIEDFLGRKLAENEKVSYGRIYVLEGNPTDDEIKSICTGILSNPQIEEFRVIKNA